MGNRSNVHSLSQRFVSMNLAEELHRNHVRRVTGEPYHTHLAEVVGLVASSPGISCLALATSIAWLHDVLEMTSLNKEDLITLLFQKGLEKAQAKEIVSGVVWLTDYTEGNRATCYRKNSSRLSKAPGYIQSIKYCDIYSNALSISQLEPEIWPIYRQENIKLLKRMTMGDTSMWEKVQHFLKNN